MQSRGTFVRETYASRPKHVGRACTLSARDVQISPNFPKFTAKIVIAEAVENQNNFATSSLEYILHCTNREFGVTKLLENNFDQL